jgi:glycerophosphoryl diester phosphodiesterase
MEHGGTVSVRSATISGVSPRIIAHRGDSAHAPENTLAAIRTAIETGADGVEFDLRLAKDGVPVVIHDANLKRTSGVSAKVTDLTSAQLAEMDVGSWFNARHPKRADLAFEGEAVPTLASALDLLSGFDGRVYIELKCGRASVVPFVDSVVGLLRGSPLTPRVIVKSFRLAALREAQQRLPELETAALFEPSILNILRRPRYIIEMARDAGAQQLSLHRALVTPRLAELARRANMLVTVWTVDNPKWLKRCEQLGIAALITNDPARMLAARDEDS